MYERLESIPLVLISLSIKIIVHTYSNCTRARFAYIFLRSTHVPAKRRRGFGGPPRLGWRGSCVVSNIKGAYSRGRGWGTRFRGRGGPCGAGRGRRSWKEGGGGCGRFESILFLSNFPRINISRSGKHQNAKAILRLLRVFEIPQHR